MLRPRNRGQVGMENRRKNNNDDGQCKSRVWKSERERCGVKRRERDDLSLNYACVARKVRTDFLEEQFVTNMRYDILDVNTHIQRVHLFMFTFLYYYFFFWDSRQLRQDFELLCLFCFWPVCMSVCLCTCMNRRIHTVWRFFCCCCCCCCFILGVELFAKRAQVQQFCCF